MLHAILPFWVNCHIPRRRLERVWPTNQCAKDTLTATDYFVSLQLDPCVAGGSVKVLEFLCRKTSNWFEKWLGKVLLWTCMIFVLWVYLIWRWKWQPSPVFLPGESHGRRSLVGYSPRGHKESDATERLHFLFHVAARVERVTGCIWESLHRTRSYLFRWGCLLGSHVLDCCFQVALLASPWRCHWGEYTFFLYLVVKRYVELVLTWL